MLRAPGDGAPNIVRYWIDGPSGVPIADVKIHGREETEADARLIAAAPDLLETCHALFKLLHDHSYTGDTPDDELDERDWEIVQMYEDPTAKAEVRFSKCSGASLIGPEGHGSLERNLARSGPPHLRTNRTSAKPLRSHRPAH